MVKQYIFSCYSVRKPCLLREIPHAVDVPSCGRTWNMGDWETQTRVHLHRVGAGVAMGVRVKYHTGVHSTDSWVSCIFLVFNPLLITAWCLCAFQGFGTARRCQWMRWRPWPLWWRINVPSSVSISTSPRFISRNRIQMAIIVTDT